MRAGPLGAYYADNIVEAVNQAERSSVVTHSHEEAVAGAVAVAVGAALARQMSQAGNRPSRSEFIDLVLTHIPDSEVKSGVRLARDISPHTSVSGAVGVLGNGTRVSAQDTVPFALWCAGEMLDDYENALWLTVSGLGDRDTTCAIVGSIVVMYTGVEAIPTVWIDSRESLPTWPFGQ
jgi:ADP-ribosylglycohydrolase